MADPVRAIRALAGLIGYNPGPGLYSRMTRAVGQMPAVIRTQELPGLLRKYPEGVPGWEVASVAPALEGVQSIPRQDLLALIQQHSPAYTHKEIVLGGRPQMGSPLFDVPEYQGSATRIGEGRSHGMARYGDYSQGGQDYSELLLLQPGAKGEEFGSHWGGHPQVQGTNRAVAHARYDIHGDALRINELQSDLGIHNRKARESGLMQPARPLDGWENAEPPDPPMPGDGTLHFPLEDAWADILIKRLALEAARGGHRAIEVASPRAIADKVGGNIDNYEHFYGKVVPGALERLGRKMGGMVDDTAAAADAELVADAAAHLSRLPMSSDVLRSAEGDVAQAIRGAGLPHAGVLAGAMREPLRLLAAAEDVPHLQRARAAAMYDTLAIQIAERTGADWSTAATLAGELMPGMMVRASQHAALQDALRGAEASLSRLQQSRSQRAGVGRRYLMSDEMRRRILEGGIGLSVLGGLSAQEE